MKTAFLISSLNAGGAERVVSLLANKLVQNREVIIITLNENAPFYELDDKIKIIQCRIISHKGSFVKGFVSNIRLILQLLKIIKSNSINHLICFMTTSNILGIIAGKFLRIKVTITERANPYLEKVGIRDLFRKVLYRWSDKLVVQTDQAKLFFSSYSDN